MPLSPGGTRAALMFCQAVCCTARPLLRCMQQLEGGAGAAELLHALFNKALQGEWRRGSGQLGVVVHLPVS